MPHKDWKVRIDDNLEAIATIQDYTVGMDLQAFLANPMAVDASAHNAMILGEAARHVPAELQARYPLVPWREMRAMRNIIAHQYRDVSAPDSSILAIVQVSGGAGTPMYIRRPFQRQPDFGVTSVNYDLAELLERAEEPQ